MSENVNWAEFRLADEWDGAERTLVVPCVAFTLYIDVTEPKEVQDFYDRFMGVFGKSLTHYIAESMGRPSPLTKRALTIVPTWTKRPRGGKDYFIKMMGGHDLGVDPTLLEFDLRWMPPRAPEQEKKDHDYYVDVIRRLGRIMTGVPCTSLRLTMPVDHELAQGAKLAEWVLGFEALKGPNVITGEVGYSINVDYGLMCGPIEKKMAALCSRYPGCDWFGTQGRWLQRWENKLDGLLPLVKRAAWMTIVNEKTVAFLGGVVKLREAFADAPEVVLHELPHGVAIQAGPEPRMGSLGKRDFLPTYRKVAKVLRPVRSEFRDGPQSGDEDWVEFWLNMFDHDWENED